MPRRSRRPPVAVIPAAGHATRLQQQGPLPCSKELLPVKPMEGGSPRPVCLHLLESVCQAGAEQAYLVLRKGKEDVPRTLGSGAAVEPDGLDLAYLWADDSRSVPESLDRAWRHIRRRRVLLGFPDTLFAPKNAFQKLLHRQELHGADIVLGLFPVACPHTTDMVALGEGGEIERIEIRPRETELTLNWLLALWRGRFTFFLHTQVAQHRKTRTEDTPELQMGQIFQRALAAGFTVHGVPFPDGEYVDIGSPEKAEEDGHD